MGLSNFLLSSTSCFVSHRRWVVSRSSRSYSTSVLTLHRSLRSVCGGTSPFCSSVRRLSTH